MDQPEGQQAGAQAGEDIKAQDQTAPVASDVALHQHPVSEGEGEGEGAGEAQPDAGENATAEAAVQEAAEAVEGAVQAGEDRIEGETQAASNEAKAAIIDAALQEQHEAHSLLARLEEFVAHLPVALHNDFRSLVDKIRGTL